MLVAILEHNMYVGAVTLVDKFFFFFLPENTDKSVRCLQKLRLKTDCVALSHLVDQRNAAEISDVGVRFSSVLVPLFC